MTEAESSFEDLFREWEDRGYDVSEMRATHGAIAAMPVGDNTPLPGSLMRDATLLEPPLKLAPEPLPIVAPVHQWWTDPPPWGHPPGRHYSISDLRAKVTRLQVWVACLTMFVISLVIVLVVKW